MNDDLRTQFEAKCFAYYTHLKAAGWHADEEGDFTHEALFWRDPNDDRMYGVRQVQAAWQGFQWAAGMWRRPAQELGAALQKIGAQLGVPVGADLTVECVQEIERLRAQLARAVILSSSIDDFMKKLSATQHVVHPKAQTQTEHDREAEIINWLRGGPHHG